MTLFLALALSSAHAEEMVVCSDTGNDPNYRGWIYCTADLNTTEGSCDAYGEFTPYSSVPTTTSLHVYAHWGNPYCIIGDDWSIENNVCESYGFATEPYNPCVDVCSEDEAAWQEASDTLGGYAAELFGALMKGAQFACDDPDLATAEAMYDAAGVAIQEGLVELAQLQGELDANGCSYDEDLLGIATTVFAELDEGADNIFSDCVEVPNTPDTSAEPDCAGLDADAQDAVTEVDDALEQLAFVDCSIDDMSALWAEDQSVRAAISGAQATIDVLAQTGGECAESANAPSYQDSVRGADGDRVEVIAACLGM